MSDEPEADDESPKSRFSRKTRGESPDSGEQPAAADGGEATTPGGFSYSVVDDGDAGSGGEAAAPARSGGVPPLALIAAAIVPALIVGAAVWFFASSGGGDKARVNADVSNVVNAFSQSQGATSTRYEGKLAPGYPDKIPLYPFR